MDDIVKSVKAHLYDRTTSPLSGAFLLSWGVWNYKMLFVLFSSLDVDVKFDYISTFLYPASYDCLMKGFVFPLLTTLFFIFIYPYPSRFVYEFWRRRQKEVKEIRQKIEDETPLTIEESREIRRAALQMEADFSRELDRKENEVRRLREELENNLELSHDAHVNGKPNNLVEAKEPLNVEQGHLDILKHIAEEGGTRVLKSSILFMSEANNVKTEYYLGQLANGGFIHEGYSTSSGENVYSLEQKGRALLVENGLY